ncbi:potassium voltage-gated channel subfamily A member 1 [Hydra vulgaris]|uniref:Potassium voltage-gated channel subfamily A member 1 n=1 Tax=Hydra vulgaris TaxID=6087 RepID=A0ABM4BDN3_HYDVU
MTANIQCISNKQELTDEENLTHKISNLIMNPINSAAYIHEPEIIRINVCGMFFETYEYTLMRFPNTLLGDRNRREKHYIRSRDIYFFDRNRDAFEAILFYYQSDGVLIRPQNIPMALFAKDVSFFELGEEVFFKLKEDEGYITDRKPIEPKREWQKVLWNLFEHPETSLAAKILSFWSVFVITLSICIFCIETLPAFSMHSNKTNHKVIMTNENRFREPWFTFELSCIAWFSFEYIIRLISSPCPWMFLKSILNFIDLLAILPYFITLSFDAFNTAPLSVLRVVRLVRAFRIFKLSRHSLGLRILGYTLKSSLSELGMLCFFLILGIILFSSAIFYAEHGHNDQFESIPDTFWFSLVTMTTVGYGDKVPKTFVGKLLGSLCAIVGVLMIALPVPVIVSNFEFFYKRDVINYETESCKKDHRKDCSKKKTLLENYENM